MPLLQSNVIKNVHASESSRSVSSLVVPLTSETSCMMSWGSGFPLSERICRLKSLPISGGKFLRWLLDRLSSLRRVRSPISPGNTRNLFDAQSSVTKFCIRPMSHGKRDKLLSFKYKCVKCVMSNKEEDMFFTFPTKNNNTATLDHPLPGLPTIFYSSRLHCFLKNLNP
jgi:hypothetical protein